MHNVSQRIHRMMDEKGLTLSAFARQTGVSKATLSKWFNSERQPRFEYVEKIAATYNIPLGYFFDEVQMPQINLKGEPLSDKQAYMNRRAYEVSAGTGRSCSAPETYKQEDGELAKVVGDSMYPTLHDGDVVRIIATSKVEPADIALVKINGDENTLKHIETTNDGVWVRGENKEVFEDMFFTIEEVLTLPVQIVGKAVEIVSRKL